MAMTAEPATRAVEAVRASGVAKRFGAVTALHGTDLVLRAGEIHALLGENGAGKTTLVRILARLEKPDAGTIDMWGEPPQRAARRREGEKRAEGGAPGRGGGPPPPPPAAPPRWYNSTSRSCRR